jgi:arylsulfatase A-like enzyme
MRDARPDSFSKATLLKIASCALSLLAAGPLPVSGELARDRPNILLIVLDDLNDWVGCLGGHPQTWTPNIDRLAATGVLFRNAHAQAPICNPSRASFLTSLYPESTGIYFNSGSFADAGVASERLLTRRFESHGYRVKGAGKLYNDNDGRYMAEHAGTFGGFGPLPLERLIPFEGERLWDWGPLPISDAEMPDHRIAEWASRELSRPRESPLFLAVGFYRPHVPLYAPQRWFTRLPEATVSLPDVRTGDLDDIPGYAVDVTRLEHIEPTHEWIVERRQWQRLVQSYLACIQFADAQIGRVLRSVETGDCRDNTYIVLFGDHGFHLGEKGGVWGKQTLWEESTRVPLIIAGPGIPAGRVCTKPVQLLDVLPTLLELSGLPAGQPMEGRSLVSLLRNPDADWPHVARTSFGPGNVALRSERYRYIRYTDGSEEFYDHQSDPHEWENRILDPDLAPVIAAHRAQLPRTQRPIVGAGSTGHKAYAAAGRRRDATVKTPASP